MKIAPGVCVGLIPARGGSKSIPLKNIALFEGRPLIDYVTWAAKACPQITRIICSTDSSLISDRCSQLGVEVLPRPDAMSGDNVDMPDVISHVAYALESKEGAMPEMMALLMPTSPFILPEHLSRCITILSQNPEAGSTQTVIQCPHVEHAFNQRVIVDGHVQFRFLKERKKFFNKQKKPKHFLFGNLVVVRTAACIAQSFVFATPSLPVEIPYLYGFDADGPDDFTLGSLIANSGLVSLPHMPQQSKSPFGKELSRISHL